MKKLLSGLFFALMLVAPSFSYAQVVDSTPATVSDLDSLKVQLIDLLLQEVKLLQAQLTSLQDQQTTTAADVATIKANTTPVSTGGAPDNTVSQPTPADPTVSYSYDKASGTILYTGAFELRPENITYMFCTANHNCSQQSSASTIVDSVQNNGSYSEHVRLAPSVSSQLTDKNLVISLRTQVPGWGFANLIEVDSSGNQITYNPSDD